MQPAVTSYLTIAAIAAAVTVMAVPIFRAWALRRGSVVAPGERMAHEQPTPSLGGGGMFVGFAVAFGLAWYTGWFESSFSGTTEPFGVLALAAISYLVGVLDDIRDLSAPAKTAGLVLAASALAFSGVSLIWFRIPFGAVFVLSPDLSFLFTVLWVMGMANAVNFIDGLDGLAAGIMGIGAVGFFAYSLRLSEADLLVPGNIGILVAAITIGICVGFLPWNLHPAKIFMGDGGSLLLGGLMAASTMAVGGRTPDPFSGQTFFFYAPIVIPLVILGVPIFDTVFAIVRRASRGQGLATADKDHLHHRLMRLGHGHRRSVFILWAWSALLSAIVLWPVYNEGAGDALVPVIVLGLFVLLLVSFQPGFGTPVARPSTSWDDQLAEAQADEVAATRADDAPVVAAAEPASNVADLAEHARRRRAPRTG